MFVSRNSTVLSCRCHLGGKIRAVISARAWLLSCIIDEFTACLSSCTQALPVCSQRPRALATTSVSWRCADAAERLREKVRGIPL